MPQCIAMFHWGQVRSCGATHFNLTNLMSRQCSHSTQFSGRHPEYFLQALDLFIEKLTMLWMIEIMVKPVLLFYCALCSSSALLKQLGIGHTNKADSFCSSVAPSSRFYLLQDLLSRLHLLVRVQLIFEDWDKAVVHTCRWLDDQDDDDGWMIKNGRVSTYFVTSALTVWKMTKYFMWNFWSLWFEMAKRS